MPSMNFLTERYDDRFSIWGELWPWGGDGGEGCELLVKEIASGGLLPNADFSSGVYMCEETSIGGERTTGGIIQVGVQC